MVTSFYLLTSSCRVKSLPGLRHLQRRSTEVSFNIFHFSGILRMTPSSSKTLSAFVTSDNRRPLISERPFDDYLYILYSSGTRVPLQCIVHSGEVCECYTTTSHTTTRVYSFKLRRNLRHMMELEYTTHFPITVYVFVLVILNNI